MRRGRGITYKVALCGLTARDERLIEIVISRAPDPKHLYTVGQAAALGKAHIAVVDAASLHVESQLVNLRTLNPALIVVYVSDLGLSGESRYRIERRSLLLHIGRVLDSVVVNELQTASGASATTPPKANAASAVQGKSVASPDSTGGSPVRPLLQPLRALIVDDSLAVREQRRSALDRSGILSDSAQDAVSAIAQLTANRYDLAFLDVVMPGCTRYIGEVNGT